MKNIRRALIIIVPVVLFVVVPYYVTDILAALFLTMVIVLFFFISIGYSMKGSLLGVFIDKRNKVSLSVLQIVVWTTIVLAAVITAVMYNIRFYPEVPMAQIVLPGLPDELLVLIGISSASFVSSPFIKHLKEEKGTIDNNDTVSEASFYNIFEGEEVDSDKKNNKESVLDIGKVQMFLFTVIVVAIYIIFLVNTLRSDNANNRMVETLPPLNKDLLYLIGISHTGYLLHKSVPHAKK